MSESQYEAMRAFIRVAVELEVKKAIPEQRAALLSEVRSSLPTETRSEPVIGPKGDRGDNGKDGIGIADLAIRDANLIVRLSDGTEKTLGRVVGEKGDPGINGKNGDNGKDSVVPGAKGDKGERGADGIGTREELESIAREINADLQVRTFADVYQGVYENGRLYERGLLATWGGSLWLSEKETKTKPGESPDWKLVVKRGADGKK
jgi:hypothetical protein